MAERDRARWSTTPAVWLIEIYRALAPVRIRQACRFEPTCSHFAEQALRHWGYRRGLRLIWRRLNACKPPFGGADPMPLSLPDYACYGRPPPLRPLGLTSPAKRDEPTTPPGR